MESNSQEKIHMSDIHEFIKQSKQAQRDKFRVRKLEEDIIDTTTLNDTRETRGGTNVLSGGTTQVNQNYMIGTFKEHFSFTVASNGSTITGTLVDTASNNYLTQFWSDGESILDVTSETIALTPGSATVPKTYYLYYLQTDKTTLVDSESGWPAGEHIKVGITQVATAAIVQSDGGPWMLQNYNNSWINIQGWVDRAGTKIRSQGVTYISGIGPNGATSSYFTLSASNSYFLSTSGEVWQFNQQTVAAITMSSSPGDSVVIYNHPTPYTRYTNLFSITVDSANTTITANQHFNLVFAVIASKEGANQQLVCFLPSSAYSAGAAGGVAADDDSDNTSSYAYPVEWGQTIQFICRATFTMGSTWTLRSVMDLRGSFGARGGVKSISDHGDLQGLTDDDHPQYTLADGTRDFTGDQSMGGNALTNTSELSHTGNIAITPEKGDHSGGISLENTTVTSGKYGNLEKSTADTNADGDKIGRLTDVYFDYDSTANSNIPVNRSRVSNAGAAFSTKTLMFDWYNWTSLLMDLDRSGNLTIQGSYSPSDIRFKNRGTNLSGILDQFREVDIFEYTWKHEMRAITHLDTKKHIGISAQDIETLWPHLVNTSVIHTCDEEKGILCKGGTERKTLSTEIVFLALQMIKELTAENDVLKTQLADIEQRLQSIGI